MIISFLVTLWLNEIFFDLLEPQKIIGKLPCTLYWLRGSPSLLPLLFSFVMRNAIQLMAGEVEKKQCSLFFCLWRLRRDHNPGTEETCTLRYRRNPIKSQYLVLLFPLTCSKPSFYVQNVIIQVKYSYFNKQHELKTTTISCVQGSRLWGVTNDSGRCNLPISYSEELWVNKPTPDSEIWMVLGAAKFCIRLILGLKPSRKFCNKIVKVKIRKSIMKVRLHTGAKNWKIQFSEK